MFSRELNKHETFEKFINESCESQLKGVAWLPLLLFPDSIPPADINPNWLNGSLGQWGSLVQSSEVSVLSSCPIQPVARWGIQWKRKWKQMESQASCTARGQL